MIIYSILPLYRKESINYNAEIEQNKIGHKQVLSALKEKEKVTIEEVNNQAIIPEIKEVRKKVLWLESVKLQSNQDQLILAKKEKIKNIKVFFKKQKKELKRVYKEKKLLAKINFMAAVSKNKELKENVKLTKKSKSNLHQILYTFSKLPYDEKKNSLVVQELSPSREAKFSIKKRVFNDLSAYGDKSDDRVYASEKDIIFTTIQFGTGTEKIPMVLRYAGQCVPIFLDKIRDDTYDKFSTENEHHIMLYSARIRETKAPKGQFKMGKVGAMAIVIGILIAAYLGYTYYKGGT